MKKIYFLVVMFLFVGSVSASGKWEADRRNNLVGSDLKEEISCTKKVCNINIIIPADYNGSEVNIVPSVFGGENAVSMPGDTYEFIITITNNSNNKFLYRDNSFFVNPYSSDNNYLDAMGFDKCKIPSSATMYRLSTTEPLMYLFDGKKLSLEQLSDEAIASKLELLGYTNGIEDLDNYYIDYFNKNYKTSFTNLEDLDTKFINKIWPNISEYPTVLETNNSLIEFNYNYFYNRLLSLRYNNKSDLDSSKYSIGEYLRSNVYDEVNDSFKKLVIEANNSYKLDSFYLHLNGPLTNNSYVLFKYGLDLGFALDKEIKYGKVNAYYIDTMGNYLTDVVVLRDEVGHNYVSEEKSFDGYKLVRIDGNKSGVFKEAEQDVYYMYDKVVPEEIPDDELIENDEIPETQEVMEVDDVNTGVNDHNYLIINIIILGVLLVIRKMI